MKRILSSLMAVAVLFAASAAHAACTTDTPLSVWGQNGSNGLVASTGTPMTYDAGSVVGQITNDLTDLDGTAHLYGSAECDTGDLAALAGALSTPVWLEPGENFAISGGLGFGDDATAVGATGVLRLGKNLSGFAGGAFSTDNSDVWAGKVGLRVGW